MKCFSIKQFINQTFMNCEQRCCPSLLFTLLDSKVCILGGVSHAIF